MVGLASATLTLFIGFVLEIMVRVSSTKAPAGLVAFNFAIKLFAEVPRNEVGVPLFGQVYRFSKLCG